MNVVVLWIFLEQDLQLLDRLGYLARDRGIVPGRREIFFRFNQVVAEQVSPTHTLHGEFGFSLIAVTPVEEIVGSGKVRVQFHGALKERNGCCIPFFVPRRDPFAVRLQGFERRGGYFFQGPVVFADGSKRFPKLGSQVGSSLSQTLQHLFAAFRFCLVCCQSLTRLAVADSELQQVVAADARERTSKQRLARGAQAYFACNFESESVAGGAFHHLQCLVHPGVRKRADERRLLQINSQGFFQRVVKHQLAGAVVKVGKDDHVLVVKRRVWTHVAKAGKNPSNHCQQQGGNENFGERAETTWTWTRGRGRIGRCGHRCCLAAIDRADETIAFARHSLNIAR